MTMGGVVSSDRRGKERRGSRFYIISNELEFRSGLFKGWMKKKTGGEIEWGTWNTCDDVCVSGRRVCFES